MLGDSIKVGTVHRVHSSVFALIFTKESATTTFDLVLEEPTLEEIFEDSFHSFIDK